MQNTLTEKRKYLGEDKHSPERVDELVTSSLEQGPQNSCNTARRLIYSTISARRAVPENTAFLFQRTARSAHPAGERVAFITENVRLTVRLERVFRRYPLILPCILLCIHTELAVCPRVGTLFILIKEPCITACKELKNTCVVR